MRIVIGCDEAAFELKTIIIDYLKKNPNIEVEDFGSFLGETVLYPDIAKRVAEAVEVMEVMVVMMMVVVVVKAVC